MLRSLLIVLSILVYQIPVSAGELQPLYPDSETRDLFRNLGPEKVRAEETNSGSYSKERRIFSQVSEPAYKIVKAEESANTGVGIIIFPGGGFVDIWFDKEGSDIANWLSKRGLTSMIVKYSTLKNADGTEIMPWETYQDEVRKDAAKAFETFRELSPALKVDQKRIGVMGFSAGAAVAHWHIFGKRKNGQCCSVNEKLKPGFAGFIYGAGFRNRKADPPFHLLDNPESLPPFFMIAAGKDPYIPLNGPSAMEVYNDILKAVPDSELHVYGIGGHGFALDKRGHSASKWLDSFYLWLQDIGMINLH